MRIKKDEPIAIKAALERRMLHGLALEWDIALWHLEAAIRERVLKPRFSLRDMGRRLGTWSLNRKEISLNRQLVMNHPWAAVREVLHHEMAHQIADEVFGGQDETAHGPLFKEACRSLRIDSVATATYAALDDLPHAGQDCCEDRVLVRIRKLLALAKSQNAHEAEAAMLKAHELITKYHVDLLLLETKRSYASRLVSTPELRHTREKYQLSSLLQEFYFVQGIWVPVFVVEKGKMGRALEISGTAEDVDLAAYVYDFVIGFINSQWQIYSRGSSPRSQRKIDFAVGVLAGFRGKLDSQKKRLIRTEATYALIEREDPHLVAYMAYKHPRTTRVHHKPIMQDSKTLSDGIEIGRKLVVFRGITEKKHGTQRLPMLE
jgi:predicted SprT family Zn-dependent metalloprotease